MSAGAYQGMLDRTRARTAQRMAGESVCVTKGCKEIAGAGHMKCPEHNRQASRDANRRFRATPEGAQASRDASRRHDQRTGYAKQRRRREREAGASYEDLSRQELHDRAEGICCVCGLLVSLGDAVVEHCIPVARFQEYADQYKPKRWRPSRFRSALGVAHPECNGGKGAKDPAAYMLERFRQGLPVPPPTVEAVA